MLRSTVISAALSSDCQTAAPACPCCEMKSSVQSGRKSGYDIFHCRDCGLGYVYPLPQADELSSLYSIAPRNLPRRMKTYVEEVATSPNSPRREWFDHVIRVAQKYSGQQKLRILEVGSGYGAFVHYASKTHTVTGTEVSKEIAAAGNGMISNVQDCGFYERLPDSSFELIYMEHVLEHVPTRLNCSTISSAFSVRKVSWSSACPITDVCCLVRYASNGDGRARPYIFTTTKWVPWLDCCGSLT